MNTTQDIEAFLTNSLGFKGIKKTEMHDGAFLCRFDTMNVKRLEAHRFVDIMHHPTNPSAMVYTLGANSRLTVDMAKNALRLSNAATTPLTTSGTPTHVGVPPLSSHHIQNVPQSLSVNPKKHFRGELLGEGTLLIPLPVEVLADLKVLREAETRTGVAYYNKAMSTLKDLWVICNRKKFKGRLIPPHFEITESGIGVHGIWYPSQRIFGVPLELFSAPVNYVLQIMLHECCHQYTYDTDVKRVINDGKEGHGEFWQETMRNIGLRPFRYSGRDVLLRPQDEAKMEYAHEVKELKAAMRYGHPTSVAGGQCVAARVSVDGKPRFLHGQVLGYFPTNDVEAPLYLALIMNVPELKETIAGRVELKVAKL